MKGRREELELTFRSLFFRAVPHLGEEEGPEGFELDEAVEGCWEEMGGEFCVPSFRSSQSLGSS